VATVVYSNIHVSTRVIAIEVSNNGGGFGGVVGSLSDGLTVTDDTWKCTTTLHDNWNQVNFDDSSWSQAVATPQVEVQQMEMVEQLIKHSPPTPSGFGLKSSGRLSTLQLITTIYCRKRR
jgi:hypothetical protein